MKKIVYFILIAYIFSLTNSFAINSANIVNQNKSENKLYNKEKLIQSWKNKKQNIIKEIYAQTNISSLMDLNKAISQLEDINFKLKNISISYKTIKLQKKNIDKKYKEVLSGAKQVVKELHFRSEKLKDLLLSIQILSRELNNIKKQIQDIKDTIYISKKQVQRYIAILYKINNDYYSLSVSQLDDLKLIFKSANLAKTLSQEDIIKILSIKTQELLSKLEEAQKIKKKFLRKLYLKKSEYINLVNSYKTEIDVLNEKRKFLVDLLTMLKSNKKEIDKYYERVFKKRVSFKKQQMLIRRNFEKQKQENNYGTGENMKLTKAIDLSDILKYTIKPDGDKFLNWPVKDNLRITSYFKDESYYKRFGWEHDGIDIKLKQGTEIYAPAAGYVYKVVDNDSDYYNYVILVHNYGYITLYGHISKALVKEGQIVKRGQIIALSGGKKGTRGAGKLSTGPHLHFEVYKNGQLIDPFSVMDLSVYPDKKYLSSSWHIKYIKDRLTRKIDLSSVRWFSKGLTHKQRQIKFLRRAASGFNNLTGWVQSGKKYGIDPDVAICIGYAESGLGRNTTTKYNVGNVGNNDRGDKRGYSSPQAGINAIYHALNNKYLSKYYTIYSLSRYGNKESHIYSSSTYNWYKNVVKCLSIIKGYPVDEYYPFRILSISERNKLEQQYKNIAMDKKFKEEDKN